MNNLRESISAQLMNQLDSFSPAYSELLFHIIVLVWVSLCAIVLHYVLHKIVVRTLTSFKFIDRRGSWLNSFHKHNLLHYLLVIVQIGVARLQFNAWLDKESIITQFINSSTDLFILFFGLISIFAVLNSVQSMMNAKGSKLQIPIRGAIQTAKLILCILFGLITIAIILGKSILVLLSGLGALSAVLMLVFKDPILGLAAGIQLSVNDMLMVGDWLEMPKYNADGEVVDIGLTTVKVQNWDKTITTIPTYALISDSFKNWRGMSESGARRIKRSLLINTASIKFLDNKDIERLKRSQLLTSYIEDKIEVLQKENKLIDADMNCLINGRRMTSIGTFREYLVSYLKNHPKIRQDMTLMVRQLEPTNKGLPLEIYVFTNTTKWLEYEDIQSDIFDHIFAVLGEFDLLAHESPIGEDLKHLHRN